jgi:hypothetical protein
MTITRSTNRRVTSVDHAASLSLSRSLTLAHCDCNRFGPIISKSQASQTLDATTSARAHGFVEFAAVLLFAYFATLASESPIVCCQHIDESESVSLTMVQSQIHCQDPQYQHHLEGLGHCRKLDYQIRSRNSGVLDPPLQRRLCRTANILWRFGHAFDTVQTCLPYQVRHWVGVSQ